MLELIPNNLENQEIHEKLKDLPENYSLFKCHICKQIFDIFSGAQGLSILIALSDKKDIRCPKCSSENVELMCKVDSYSIYLKLKGFECRQETIINKTDLCPICDHPMCPQCFNHSVVSLSRVTGYIQDIGGWNAGKRQELMDRKRYTKVDINR